MRILTGLVVLLLSGALGSIIYAQYPMTPPAHDEPGLYSFYYPNNDVLYDGVPTPAAYIGSTVIDWLSPLSFGGRRQVMYAAPHHGQIHPRHASSGYRLSRHHGSVAVDSRPRRLSHHRLTQRSIQHVRL